MPGLERFNGGITRKGGPEEKSVILRKVCLLLKVGMGLPVKILLLHMATTRHSAFHTSMVSQLWMPNGKRWLKVLHWTLQSQRVVAPLPEPWQQHFIWRSSAPTPDSRLCKHHLVSIARIWHKLPENLPASATAVSNSSKKNDPTSRSHAETWQEFTQPRRLEMLC